MLLAAALTLAACGGEEEQVPAPLPELPEASPIARIAVAGPVDTLDPVFARKRTERLISRQIYEPLISTVGAPFGVADRRRGPARTIGSAAGDALWSFQLRSGLQFQDGTPLNADAVVANYDRWVATGVAARVLPELRAVDSPRPGEIRFQLSEPVADFPARLGDARLGLVSPTLIDGRGARPIRREAIGAGPYQLRAQSPTRMLLVRTIEWWGEAAELGPGINQLDFVLTPSDLARFEQLSSGGVAIADDLGPEVTEQVQAQPLLATIGDGGVTIGFSAAVRGLTSVSVDQSLSELWLTDLR